jgi:hypothetical protein
LSDEIERIIRRDLERLPVFPESRWVPQERSHARLGMVLGRAALTVAFVGLALVASVALLRVRGEFGGSTLASPTPATATPTATGSAVPASSVVSRQSVLASVRASTGLYPRLQRYEAKLVSSADLNATSPFGAPQGTLFWVVAANGDVNCSFRCIVGPGETLHSAIVFLDAYTGALLGGGQGVANWPDGFDALPDRLLAPGSQTIVGSVTAVRGNSIEIQPVAGQAHIAALVLETDDNTAYAWEAGLAGGSALTLDELPELQDPQVLTSVTFDPVAKTDGSYRLERLVVGVNTK